MNTEEIKDKITKAINGQGNQVDVGGVLAGVLYDIVDELDAIKHTHALLIQSSENVEAGGYQVPSLTAEQVTLAYNAVVTGRAAIIVDRDEVMHAYVNQADNLNDELSIGILFYSYLLLTYTINGEAVTITASPIGND